MFDVVVVVVVVPAAAAAAGQIFVPTNIQKLFAFSGIFVPLKGNTLVFTMFLQHQGRKSSKTLLFTLFFSDCVENADVLRCFFNKGA